jgi:outer membrane cobalamin receptor
VTLAAACAPAPQTDAAAPKEREGPIITREEIARSGATNGWEALRLASTHLNFQYTREGSPVRVTHRGVDSFIIDPQVLLVVDGVQMQSLEALENIPATNIEYIQILAARVGVVKYGTNAGNGVVVVKTGVPPPKGPS